MVRALGNALTIAILALAGAVAPLWAVAAAADGGAAAAPDATTQAPAWNTAPTGEAPPPGPGEPDNPVPHDGHGWRRHAPADQEPGSAAAYRRALSAVQRRSFAGQAACGLVNVAVGAPGVAIYEGGGNGWFTSNHFHMMNTIWGVADVLGGAGGMGGLALFVPEQATWATVLSDSNAASRDAIFSAGLDVAWILGGAFMRERGLRRDKAHLVGYGDAIIVQAVFQLLHDGGRALRLRTLESIHWTPILERLGPDGTPAPGIMASF